MARNKKKIVYVLEDDDFIHKPEPQARPRPPVSLLPQEQTARIQREKKGRGGKQVTVIRELQLGDDDLNELAKKLKKTCGSGGTIKEGAIEIQGDHRAKIAEALQKLGYKTKFVGG